MALLIGGLVLLGALGEAGSTEPRDRLDRFRDLGRRLQAGPETPAALPGPIRDELLALVDDEVLDNLRSGGPFAAPVFILERLRMLAEVWGGATFEVQPLAAPRAYPASLMVTVDLAGPPPAGSVRIYGGPSGDPRLVHAETREGRPHASGWPSSRTGVPQFAVAWDDPSGAPTSRPVEIAVWRLAGAGRPARVWRGPGEDAGPPRVRDYALRPGEIVVRYETPYPGWKPGCEGQTMHEDVYRVPPGGDGIVVARRRVLDGWHRELGMAVARLFAAMERGDARALAALVPEASLRRRLPVEMRLEAVCDMPGERPGTVVVAATAGERTPWSLTWRRDAGGWRLSAAGPVLQ